MSGKNEKYLFLNRINCSLNRSHSKQSYTFSKAERFKEIKKDNSYAFYNIPNTRDLRSTSIGFGRKYDFTKSLNHSLSQTLYGFPSSFDPKYHNSPQYTFGVSRSLKKKIIGNGSNILYDLSKKFGDDAPKYSISTKANKSKINTKLIYPGPGAYFNYEKSCSTMGKYFNSKYKNMSGVNLDMKEKRFFKKIDAFPSPQAYHLPSLIKNGGYIYESKYKSSLGRSFIGVKCVKKKLDFCTPGPGAYRTFSEFEGYDNCK